MDFGRYSFAFIIYCVLSPLVVVVCIVIFGPPCILELLNICLLSIFTDILFSKYVSLFF
jgi:hypothetical protein